jgi:outer membrane protein assembly factor BamB
MNTLQLSDEKKERLLRFHRLFRNITIVTGVFSAVVIIILGLSVWQFKVADPINTPHLPKFIEQIQQGNQDPEFLEAVRTYDLMIRNAHFTALAFNHFGAYLLLGGLSIFLLCLKLTYEFKRQLPKPDKFQEPEENMRKTRILQFSILGAALVIVLLAFLLPTLLSKPWSLPGQQRIALPTLPIPGEETLKSNWTSFRGYHGLGLALAQDPPTEWNVDNNKNILWKIALPKSGFNSPIIWDNRIFLSGADDASRDVFCFDFTSGELLWQKSTTVRKPFPLPAVTEDTGLAAPTLTTDGRYVCAIFATGEVICLTLDGTIQWEKKLPVPTNHYGHSSSLLLYKNLLLIQYDSDQKGKVLALDVSTGKRVWQKKRVVDTSWSSPIIVPSDTGDQLILTSTPLVIAYDPNTGKELWQMEEVITGEIGPSPAFADNHLFFMNQFSRLISVSLSDQTIAWENDRNLSDIPSPAVHLGFLIVPTSHGPITCLDAQTGKILWKQSFPNGFQASPIICQDRVYALDSTGVMHIFKLDKNYSLLAEPAVPEECVATPAFAQNKIIIRGKSHLYCIGQKIP